MLPTGARLGRPLRPHASTSVASSSARPSQLRATPRGAPLLAGRTIRAVFPLKGSRSKRVIVLVEAQASSATVGAGASYERLVQVDNTTDDKCTVLTVSTEGAAEAKTMGEGLMSLVTATIRDLGLVVDKAVVDPSNKNVLATFYVTDFDQKKLTDVEDLTNIRICIATVVDQEVGGKMLAATPTPAAPEANAVEVAALTEKEKLRAQLLYEIMGDQLKNDVPSLQESIINHVEYTLARSRYRFDDFEAYQATSLSVRDRLIESWNDTQAYYRKEDPKRVYYMSMEFLTGRSLLNATYNLGLKESYTEALTQLGYDMEILVQKERDAALGNGGLGRLAACFLDSMATLDLPAWGYGIRYQYGMFRQTLIDGFQREAPDYWLNFGNPWEIMRPNVSYTVKFYGHVSTHEVDGRTCFRWNAGESVEAVAYDNPVPGWNTPNVNNLRLWSASPTREFDLESFNTGDYVSAILDKQRAETLSAVLYPDDRTYQGRELRLKQQHFLVSATLQDIIRRYKETHSSLDAFPDKVALQLNDTHPTIGIPELMRLLMDENGLGWTKAWDITTRVYSFTNHTVLPEALEKWPTELMEALLPRHMQIVYDINWRFLQELRSVVGDDFARMGRMSIIEENESGKSVRMAHLAIVACHAVNGVAAIHSKLIKTTIFKEFYDIMPQKFQNKTNGVTQRRWLAFCNPEASALITKSIGSDAWKGEFGLISGLHDLAEDKQFQQEWRAVKQHNKQRLADTIANLSGVKVSTDALFDIQVKRIHEYKRQMLNVLWVIHRYTAIQAMSEQQRSHVVPRVVVIGGKAAPGYDIAKRVIKLISAVSDKVNNDPVSSELLKLVFLPDYNVSLAEVIVPGADLSQHISTAGTEASGTSNMKFAMNGCLILGTMDGANVEIAEEVGEENMFIFGAHADEVEGLRSQRPTYECDPRFGQALELIRNGVFGWADFFAPVVDSVSGGHAGSDYYLLGPDFGSYCEAQERVDATYMDQDKWTRMSILNTAGCGKFSSDRTIQEYADDIWHVQPCRRPETPADK